MGTDPWVRVEHDGEAVLISCFPAFVKLRWRKGQFSDAKAYLKDGSYQTDWQ